MSVIPSYSSCHHTDQSKQCTCYVTSARLEMQNNTLYITVKSFATIRNTRPNTYMFSILITYQTHDHLTEAQSIVWLWPPRWKSNSAFVSQTAVGVAMQVRSVGLCRGISGRRELTPSQPSPNVPHQAAILAVRNYSQLI